MTENPNKNMIPEANEISDDELDAVAGGVKPSESEYSGERREPRVSSTEREYAGGREQVKKEIDEKGEACMREADIMKRNNWVVCGKF